MNFRALVSEMDDAIYEALSDDDIVINGQPVCGMFYAPWLQPQLGRLNTGILEPQVHLRETAAAGIAIGMDVYVGGTRYEIVSLEPDSTGNVVIVLREWA